MQWACLLPAEAVGFYPLTVTGYVLVYCFFFLCYPFLGGGAPESLQVRGPKLTFLGLQPK